VIQFRDIYRVLSSKWQNAFLDYPVDLKSQYGSDNDFNKIINSLFEKNESNYSDLLKEFLTFKKNFYSISYFKTNDTTSPYWNNDFFPGLDVIALYGIIRMYRPNRYVEIGSGSSTKVAYKAKSEGQIKMQIISVDPYPRSEVDLISDKIIRMPIEKLESNDSIFTSLEPNDILFIDSSHRLLPNSDCSFIYNELIPSLPKGVLIHIHDIYLPYDYPQFMCDRLYNENQTLACYFLSNHSYFQILLPNFYIYKNEKVWNSIAPIFEHPNMKDVEKHGGSIWLIKN